MLTHPIVPRGTFGRPTRQKMPCLKNPQGWTNPQTVADGEGPEAGGVSGQRGKPERPGLGGLWPGPARGRTGSAAPRQGVPPPCHPGPTLAPLGQDQERKRTGTETRGNRTAWGSCSATRAATRAQRALGLIPQSDSFLPIQLEPALDYSQLMTMPTATATRHADDCARVFKRIDPRCPRCVELASGAAPRAGWSDNKRRAEAMRCAAGIDMTHGLCDRCGALRLAELLSTATK